MAVNTTIISPNITWNTNSASGTYPMLPFNAYIVNSSGQTLTLPTTPQIGDTYKVIGANSAPFIIKANFGQVILWQTSGGTTLTSPGSGYSSSITITYVGLLFSGGTAPTFIAEDTNGAAFVISA